MPVWIFEECFESMDESASDPDEYRKIPDFCSKANAIYIPEKRLFIYRNVNFKQFLKSVNQQF